MSEFYDGTKLLSLSDSEGKKPEIYICTGNRSAGKTFYFNRYCVKKFLETGEKFGILYRWNYELDDCADKFFKDIGSINFTDYYMFSKPCSKSIYHELYICKKGLEEKCGIHCGYAITLNSADQIKKMAHLFSDIERMIFDEFQSETNHYCPNEVNKLLSVHTSIARGGGKSVRYVPVFMISNKVSLINPYFTEMGISNRLSDKTKFLKGDGYVLEQTFNENASIAQKESGFNRAFSGNKYTLYSSENVYLNDNTAFIEKPTGNSRYICTIKYEGVEYGIREFAELGVLFVDDRSDSSFPLKITTTTEDHAINYVMLKRQDNFISVLRTYFEKGCFRFKNLKCKDALLSALSY